MRKFNEYKFPEPKAYQLNKMLFDIHKDRILREKFLKNMDHVISQYNLTPEQVEAVKSGNPVKMYDAGAHPVLLFLLVWVYQGKIMLPEEEQRALLKTP